MGVGVGGGGWVSRKGVGVDVDAQRYRRKVVSEPRCTALEMCAQPCHATPFGLHGNRNPKRIRRAGLLLAQDELQAMAAIGRSLHVERVDDDVRCARPIAPPCVEGVMTGAEHGGDVIKCCSGEAMEVPQFF